MEPKKYTLRYIVEGSIISAGVFMISSIIGEKIMPISIIITPLTRERATEVCTESLKSLPLFAP